MPYLRFSRARNAYVCSGCGVSIPKRQMYFRDEPHPMARLKRGLQVQYLCVVCVLGELDAREYLGTGRLQYAQRGELEFTFGTPQTDILCIPPRVHLDDFTPHLMQQLAVDPDLLQQFSPAWFESLVFDRLY